MIYIEIMMNIKQGAGMEKHTTIIRNIDKGLWLKFRKMCLDKGISANKQIVELIKSFVKGRNSDGH